jgi:hypothetical protein
VPTGRRTVNTDPLLGSLVTITSPPIIHAEVRSRLPRLLSGQSSFRSVTGVTKERTLDQGRGLTYQ